MLDSIEAECCVGETDITSVTCQLGHYHAAHLFKCKQTCKCLYELYTVHVHCVFRSIAGRLQKVYVMRLHDFDWTA
jgi:hypothetical protein